MLMVDVLHHERVERFLGAEQTGQCRAQRQNQPLFERGTGRVGTGDPPAGVQPFDELADVRRLAGTLGVVHRVIMDVTRPSTGLLAVAYIFRGIRPAR